MNTLATGKRARTFDFEGRTDLYAALRIIDAALDDEGLRRHESNTKGDRPYAVWMPEIGITRIFIPPTRIVEK